MNAIRREIETIYAHRKIETCAAAMGVAKSTAYRYRQPVTANGEVIPLVNLIALNADIGKSGNVEALKSAYRLGLVIVAPLGACVVDKELLLNCLNGLPLRALTMPKEVTEMCKHCDEPVRYLPVCQCRWSRT